MCDGYGSREVEQVRAPPRGEFKFGRLVHETFGRAGPAAYRFLNRIADVAVLDDPTRAVDYMSPLLYYRLIDCHGS